MQSKICLVFLFFCSLLYVSCSSDPCDDIACVNGACNEGICGCDEGWKGPSCSEIDYNFVGEYRSTVFGNAECPNPSDAFTLNANADNDICNTTGNVTNCISTLLRFDEDGTYFLNIIATEITPTTRIGDPTVVRGNYSVDGNKAILFCDDQECSSMTLDISQQVITWDQREATSSQCAVRWELTRQ